MGENASAVEERTPDAPVAFKEAFQAELEQIARSRQARGVSTTGVASDTLVGLAFSGGGIRSATFNLGILQALARRRLLHKFDYLSTVSGGGYIGSWLAALTLRFARTVQGSSFADVEDALVREAEPPFLRWLRQYSNYLTPHRGLLSVDALAMIATWLRNVLLNHVLLCLLVLGLLGCCHSTLLFLLRLSVVRPLTLLNVGAIAWFVAAVSMIASSPLVHEDQAGPATFSRVTVATTVIGPFFLACLFLNSGLWELRTEAHASWLVWTDAGAIFYALAWAIASATVSRQRRISRGRRLYSLAAFIACPLAGAVGGSLVWAYWELLALMPRDIAVHLAVQVLGTGALMAVMLVVGALHLILAGRGVSPLVRDWWTRLGVYMMLVTLGWVALAGMVEFGPLCLRYLLFKLGAYRFWGLLVLWVVFAGITVSAARSGGTDGSASLTPLAVRLRTFWTELLTLEGDVKTVLFIKVPQRLLSLLRLTELSAVVARVGPYVYAVGLLLILSTLTHIGSGLLSPEPGIGTVWGLSRRSSVSFPSYRPGTTTAPTYWLALAHAYWEIQCNGRPLLLALTSLSLVMVTLLLVLRVGVNEFSFRYFLYGRLSRYFLGASNSARKPQPFTGFDPDDDFPLSDLAVDYPGPYPILNAALNITSGAELGFATRVTKPFVFTPLFSGYRLEKPDTQAGRFVGSGEGVRSFLPTSLGRAGIAASRGITLGTAMAISGAGPNRNIGYHASPATSALMVLFDSRLDWCVGNPRYPKKWQSSGPALGPAYLLSELLSPSGLSSAYIHLSDGGHFDNLGVYELIRRRCKLIVACDAECDGQYEFEDFIGLIEKVRTDFGVRIEVDFPRIRPVRGRRSERSFVIGSIFYDPGDPSDQGTMIYVKTSMPDDAGRFGAEGERLPDDVWQYFEKHSTFPHQTTAGQWFDTAQFESYRALGEHIGNLAATEIAKEVAAIHA